MLCLFTYLSEPDPEPEPDLEAEFEEALLFDSLSECEPEFLSDSDPDSWPDSSPDSICRFRIILGSSKHVYRILMCREKDLLRCLHQDTASQHTQQTAYINHQDVSCKKTI
jgi:hypothetical protein